MTDQTHGHTPGTGPAANLRVPAGKMAAWGVDTLPVPPPDRFDLRRFLGPGLLMVGLAIGGGEWLTGPALTAQYGGVLMWIATMSILFQCCYNLEVMRYALYCGEPMFTGFFRLAPGPRFWTGVFLVVDFGAIWPYLSANAAVPLLAAFLGHLPGTLPTTYLSQEEIVAETGLSARLVEEMSQHPGRFGRVQDIERDTGLPVEVIREMSRNPENYGDTRRWRPLPHPLTEWQDGASVTEVAARTGLDPEVLEKVQGRPDLFAPVEQVIRETGLPAEIVHEMARNPSAYGVTERWKAMPGPVLEKWVDPERSTVNWLGYAIFLSAFVPLIFGGKVYNMVEKIMAAKTVLVLGFLIFLGVFYVEWRVWVEIFSGFVKFGALPEVGGNPLTWSELFRGTFGIGGARPALDVGLLAIFAAIAGSGGLGNASFANYVRDKGWGMGARVGAIASAVGGKGISLLHEGRVFQITPESKKMWTGWRKVTIRDQLGIWVVGCILGMGIPALLSLQFAAGQQVRGDSLAALTAQGVVEKTGEPIFWFLTLLCGFLVLGPTQIAAADAFCRRWTDLIWTASTRARGLKEEKVKYVYYGLLAAYAIWGVMALTLIPDRMMIVKIAGIPLNFGLGFSALCVLAVNCKLLPRELQPAWYIRVLMVACALFFLSIACVSTAAVMRDLQFL